VSLPYPRCHDDTPHGPHPEISGLPGQDCPGWTAEQKTVHDLIAGVQAYVREHWNPREPRPEGLRVEMHPDVHRLLMRDPDLWNRPERESALEDWFPVPAKVTTDVAPGKWRLVIITEEVLLEG
jgi:hypothetical protein